MKPAHNYPILSLLHQIKTWLILIAAALLLVVVIPVNAQQSTSSGNAIDGFPVMLDGQEIFRVKQGIPGVATAEERAAIVKKRLLNVANDSTILPEAIQSEKRGNELLIKASDKILFTITPEDAIVYNKSREDLAEKAIKILRASIIRYREERKIENLIEGIVLAVISTIALLLFFKVLQKMVSKLLAKIRLARKADALDLRINNIQVLGSNAMSYLLAGFVRLGRLAIILLSLYIYLPFVLSQFPTTQPLGNSILKDIASQIEQLTETFVKYLPNLLTIGIIALVTIYIIEFAKLVILELGRDDAYPWFYSEWIQPTNRLVTFLIVAIALVVAGPFLPGFGSPAFQGVSLFLGAIFTLGSSSAVANAVAGIILIYTRAFKIGDFVAIGDTKGSVIEKSLFVTRIITPKKEVITMPNAKLLSSDVKNFSVVQRELNQHLVLYTTVTLGYDLPWRKVHEVLINAALATKYVLAEPYPFVLQTNLNDHNVSYELNAFTDHPELMPDIYSNLHQNMQDYCNQAGIEILSPIYTAIRDGNYSTIPADYLPDDYTPPTFGIHNQNGN
ncbi:mechanosensitive ion channel family protein [[Phormidium ambiguum] IAM M-71]|uniref:mechanosensitive ion channel family protein n=1 Tax=[Phormidium ambiguum] IAM M-71 TaxID=454136 RepID=UPI0009FE6BD4|nr:mechanosensitive ion channel family protein [Phormidium ambiguum]